MEDKLPHVSLCRFPTPINKLDTLGRELGLENLYIKQDGQTATPFGGNKIRKLEFLLGDALHQEAEEVLTFGYAGSNHALATAVYAKQLGLKSISMLMPQPNAHYVRRNLLMSRYNNAEFHQYPNKRFLFWGARYQKWRHRRKRGKTPYIIPPGGSSPLGTTGFINAAFELKQQIENKEIPEPDYIFAALGSAGSIVGLLIGIKALGIKTKIIPIRVVDLHFLNKQMVLDLFSQTVDLLHSHHPSFPQLNANDVEAELEIRDNYLGDGYARFTPKGMEAIALFKKTEDIQLDGTYTGKAASALIDDARAGRLKGKKVLFWNTLNAHDLSCFTREVDYHELPRSFHRYFKHPVQPLEHTTRSR